MPSCVRAHTQNTHRMEGEGKHQCEFALTHLHRAEGGGLSMNADASVGMGAGVCMLYVCVMHVCVMHVCVMYVCVMYVCLFVCVRVCNTCVCARASISVSTSASASVCVRV